MSLSDRVVFSKRSSARYVSHSLDLLVVTLGVSGPRRHDLSSPSVSVGKRPLQYIKYLLKVYMVSMSNEIEKRVSYIP